MARKKGPSAELTPKQKKFCEEYIVDLNGLQAVLRAGYNQTEQAAGVQAARLLKNTRVMARINELRQEQIERTKITADYVLNNLVEVVERCMQRAPVMVRRGRDFFQAQDDEGRDVWRFDAIGANTALKMLGQHFKMFTQKVEHTGKDDGPIDIIDNREARREAIKNLLDKMNVDRDGRKNT